MSKELEKMTPELKAFIEEWKAKPGNLIMVLHRVQQTYGYIPREIAIETSEILGVPLAKIYGVITFYNFFRLQKAGKYNIQVCLGTACYLRGGDDVLKEFEKQLGVGLNATTPDGMFSVEAVRCLGCCGLAPVAVVNGEVHGKLSTKDVENIIAEKQQAMEMRDASNKDVQVIVGMGTCGIAAGAKDTFTALVNSINEKGLTNVLIRQTGCMGLCHSEPTVEVVVPGMPTVIYGNVDAATAKDVVEKHIVGHQLIDDKILDRPSIDIIKNA